LCGFGEISLAQRHRFPDGANVASDDPGTSEKSAQHTMS